MRNGDYYRITDVDQTFDLHTWPECRVSMPRKHYEGSEFTPAFLDVLSLGVLSIEAPLLKTTTVAALGKDFLSQYGQLLPLLYRKKVAYYLYYINFISAIDISNLQESQEYKDYYQLPNYPGQLPKNLTGCVEGVNSLSFMEENIGNTEIFRDRNIHPKGFVFVKESFVEKVAQTKLTGFVFEEVYPTLRASSIRPKKKGYILF